MDVAVIVGLGLVVIALGIWVSIIRDDLHALEDRMDVDWRASFIPQSSDVLLERIDHLEKTLIQAGVVWRGKFTDKVRAADISHTIAAVAKLYDLAKTLGYEFAETPAKGEWRKVNACRQRDTDLDEPLRKTTSKAGVKR